MKLLPRAPADRPDPLEIAGVVQTPLAASVQRAGSPDELIGRETHLAALSEANDVLKRTGQSVTVFISGRSGEGKTSLAERFLAPIRKSSRHQNASILSACANSRWQPDSTPIWGEMSDDVDCAHLAPLASPMTAITWICESIV